MNKKKSKLIAYFFLFYTSSSLASISVSDTYIISSVGSLSALPNGRFRFLSLKLIFGSSTSKSVGVLFRVGATTGVGRFLRNS